MRESANKTTRNDESKRVASKRIKEKLSEGAFTAEELQELLLVAPDILDRKRY